MPRPRFIVIVLVLLALNYVSVALFAPGKEPRSTSRTTRRSAQQVDGRATSSASPRTGETVDGEFKKAVKLPDDAKAQGGARTSRPRSRRSPTPTSSRSCSQDHDVDDPGQADQLGPRLLANLILGFGPVILLVGAVRVARPPRGAARQMGALGAFGALARAARRGRRAAGHVQRRGRHRRGQGRADRDRRLPQEPRAATSGSAAGSRAACCSPAGPAPARRCWRARSRARPSVPFFSISASEFVEAIVGIGASRVRDLFKQAKEASPAIIFIDELDAIGRSRSPAASASAAATTSASRRSTRSSPRWTASSPSVAVIVLGATNRPEILDTGAAAPGPLRPPRRRAAARQGRPPQDPRGPHALAAAGRRRRPRPPRRDHARHGRRRPRQPRQRGGADSPRGATTSKVAAGRLHRRAGEDRARRAARHRALRARSAAASPTTRPATRSSACSRRAPTRCARSRSSRAAMALGVTLSRARPRRAPTTRRTTCWPRSRSRSAAASPRRSSTARSRPARSPTSSS